MTPEITFNRSAVNAGECVTEAWEMLKSKYGLYLGISLIALLMTACVPCLNIFLLGPVMGGICYVVLRDMRGESIDFGMMFKGFENFVPLMIVGLIESVPSVISQVLQYSIRLGQFASGGGTRQGSVSFYQSAMPDLAFSGVMIVVLLIVAVAAIVFAFFWWAVFFFCVPLIIDRGVGVGDAIKLSARAAMANIGGMLVLMIIEGLVMLLGFIMICIGMFLISMPIVFITKAIVYRAVFPKLEDSIRNYNPPDPGMYRDWGPGGMAA